MKRGTARRWHWAVTRSIGLPELLLPKMRGHQVRTAYVWQEPRRRRYWKPNAVSGETESRTRAWSPPRNIQGWDHDTHDAEFEIHAFWHRQPVIVSSNAVDQSRWCAEDGLQSVKLTSRKSSENSVAVVQPWQYKSATTSRVKDSCVRDRRTLRSCRSDAKHQRRPHRWSFFAVFDVLCRCYKT